MNKHVFLPITLLLLFLSLNTFAQRSDKRVYTDSGWWTLGLTGGAAWQSGDICAIPGWGAGIDLAKNIYHKPNGLLDLDLRGRLLYTQTYGADHERSYGILDNPALNGTNSPSIDYTAPNGPGFTFMNHKTHLGEASIEAVLTANRLRENTGIILQGFGGLGLNGYQTFTDQLDNRDEMYDWSEIDTDRRRLDVLSQIGTYGYYETAANDYDNAPRVSVMPSLGLGLGYQLTRNFSIGLEHKTNWALHDNLEGQQYNREDNTLSTNNDLHHYTSLYLRWRIGDRYKKESNPTTVYPPPTEGENGMTTYPGNSYGNAPIITFKKPSREGSTVSNDRISVATTIEHVDGRNNIEATFNGKPLTSYTYNTSNDKFATVLILEQGSNEIVITATNKFGKDIESRTINFKPKMDGVVDPPPPPMSKPTVNITRPTSNPYTSNQQTVSLKADVENVDSKRDITFKINGKRTYNFELDGYFGNTVTADIPLEAETTNVSITVRNDSGSDTDTQKIIYSAYCPPGGYTGNTGDDNTGPRPRVRITSPSGSTYNSTENTVPVTATIENVNNKNDITFTVNGQRKTNFNYNSSSDKFTTNVALNGERTEVIIRAVNNYGNDSDDLTIVYCPPTPRPQVTITKPMSNPHTTRNGSEPVKATVTNVNSASDISVKINNQSINNFNYSNSKNEVTFTANLQTGNNTIRIKATNLAGSDSDDVVINYNAVERPEVDIIKPNNDPYTSTNSSVGIVAVVQNVGSKNDITFKVNGRTTRSFTYSESNGKVTANINLENGNNTIRIKATNEAGSDSDDTVVKYNAVERPEVDIIKPNNNPYTSTNSSVGIVAVVQNVGSKNDITFKVNGRTTRSFTYSESNGKVTANINLENGNNTIRIKATNEAGSDSDDTVIKYNKPTRPVTTIKIPTVKITQPHESPFTISSQQVAILATIKNVTSSRNITFKVNGKTIRNFSYKPKGNAFEGTITLKEGQNNIVITASNGKKTASDSTVLIYERGQAQDQFGTTYDDLDSGGNKTSTNKGTKGSRIKKPTRKSRGN